MKRLYHSMLLNARKYLRTSDDIRGELSRGKLIFYTNVSALFIMLVFFISDLFLAQVYNVALDVIAFVFYFIGLIALYNGHLTFPKINLVVITNIILIFSASRDGRYSGNQFIWFPIMSSVFLLFSSHQKYYIIFGILSSVGSIALLEITDYSLFRSTYLDQDYLLINYLLCFAVSVLLLMIYLYVLSNMSRSAEKKLTNYNRKLKDKNHHLKKLHEELDSYIYKTTHDLRAPLNSLLGIIELCKVESDLNTIKSFVQLQEVSVRKLDAYIMDIINLSKNSRTELVKKEVDLAELINEVFNQLEYLESSVQREISVKQFTQFYSDPQRLSMIVANLVSNSIRYRDTAKKHQLVSVHAEVRDKRLLLSVKDNGLGIPKEYQQRIFELFFRANEKISGSGLGLYIVKEAVEKLNGTIQLHSEPGVGSEFIIELPGVE